MTENTCKEWLNEVFKTHQKRDESQLHKIQHDYSETFILQTTIKWDPDHNLQFFEVEYEYSPHEIHQYSDKGEPFPNRYVTRDNQPGE